MAKVQEVSKADALLIAMRKGIDAFSGYATVRTRRTGVECVMQHVHE